MDIEIFSYRVWDTRNGTHITPRRRATPSFIEKAKGEIIGTGVTVDESLVDENGQEILPDNAR